MTPRQIEEYRALRDTIRERSTARVWVALAGIVAWSALMMATAAFVELPIATLVPLGITVIVLGVYPHAILDLGAELFRSPVLRKCRENENEPTVGSRRSEVPCTGRRVEIVAWAEFLTAYRDQSFDHEEFFTSWMKMGLAT